VVVELVDVEFEGKRRRLYTYDFQLPMRAKRQVFEPRLAYFESIMQLNVNKCLKQ
jgi:hypothetical protein